LRASIILALGCSKEVPTHLNADDFRKTPGPIGSVAITGQAFGTTCANIASATPSWVADKNVVSNALTPVKLGLTNVVQIASGPSTVCARRSDGTVWCWGYDQLGTVGDGTGLIAVTTPVQTLGLPPSASISLGGEDACSLGTDQSVECWGEGQFGEFGNGSINDSFAPIPIQL
jgi:Regulator of chromosome condensation (RCC1) repeat